MQSKIREILESSTVYQDYLLSSTPLALFRRFQMSSKIAEAVEMITESPYLIDGVRDRIKELYGSEETSAGYQSDNQASLCAYMYLLYALVETRIVHPEYLHAWFVRITFDSRSDMPLLVEFVKVLGANYQQLLVL
jgi:hypothetical protein